MSFLFQRTDVILDNKYYIIYIKNIRQISIGPKSIGQALLKAVLAVVGLLLAGTRNELMFYLLLVSAFQPVDLLSRLLALPRLDLHQTRERGTYQFWQKVQFVLSCSEGSLKKLQG